MKRVIFFISAIITLCLFSSQLLALPEGAVARLGIGHVNAVTFSPDGKYLAVASSIGVTLLDPFNLTVVYSFDTTGSMTSIAFSPDDLLLASGSIDNTIKLWDVRSRTLVATLEGHSDVVRSVAFSPDGSLLASGSEDKTVKLWDMRSRTLVATLEGHSYDVNSVAFSPDGTLLASGSNDSTIKLWDVKSRTLVATLEGASSEVNSIAFSPDGLLLASGSYRTVKLWDVRSRTLVATLEGHSWYVRSVAFSPDGSLLASGSDDKTVKLWDVRSRTLVATLEGHSDMVNSVAFSPDSSLLASGSEDGTTKLWDVKNRTLTATLEGHSDMVWSVAFSPDGTLLASGSEDGTTKLWDVRSMTLVATEHSGSMSVAFSPDGSLLASGSWDETVKLWDVKSRTLVATFKGHSYTVYSVAFSPDGSLLAIGGGYFDGTIELWDVKSRTLVATLEWHSNGVNSVAFSPDGTLLASRGNDGTINLWDVRSRTLVATLEHSDFVRSIAFNPDNSLLASGDHDGTVKLWNVRSRTLVAKLKGHSDSVSSVAFSPDGSLLASGSLDDTIILWDMKPYIGQVPQQPNIVVSNKSYNFSDTLITTHSDWNFSISNTGNSDLKINGMDSDNPAFTVTPMAFPQSVVPGKALDVAVSFTPTEEKTYTGILTIKSNDPDSPTITISLNGNGIVKHDKFSVGDYVKVIKTGDSGLNIHKNDPTGEVLKVIPNGWLFKIIGGPKNNINGNNWWETQEEKYETSFIKGWVAEDFLEKVSYDSIVPISILDHFSTVSAQERVERAIRWAEGADKNSRIWEGYCLRFVAQAYGLGYNINPITTKWGSPNDAISKLGDKFYLASKSYNPPRGALVLFSALGEYEPFGHVGIYLGNGKVIHAYVTPRVNDLAGKDGVEQLSTIGSYLGWTYPPKEWFAVYDCDVNSDGVVNILDLVIVAKSFGKDVNNAKADVNKDGIVDVLDLNIVVQHLGEVYK